MLDCDVESVMKDGTVLVNPESYALPPYSAVTRGIYETYLNAMRGSNDTI